ncbi:MAG: hypothetical protein QG602_58 [Verrucomicrobiota bacterium]|nr:hypothetical protein [Verrucomicrobiota bacterium]
MSELADLYPWISVGAIAWGVLDVFFGYRVFKVTLSIVGGLMGLAAGHALATAVGFGPGAQVVTLVIGAMLGAGLAFLLYIAAVFVAGFGFGATLGMLLLANFHHMVSLLTGAVMGIIGGFLAVKMQRILIVLSTALLGAFRAVLALTYFTGQMDWLHYYRHPDHMPALIESTPWMFPSILALAAVGVIAQLELGGSGESKKKTKED